MPRRKSNIPVFITVIAVAAVIAAGIFAFRTFYKKAPEAPKTPTESPAPTAPAPVIDYNTLETNPEIKGLMDDRKAALGVDKGIDIIAKPGETIKVGDTTVSMQEILDKIQLKEGKIVEGTLNPDGTANRSYGGAYGIYVVQPGDNIWNIHFTFLQNYFRNKGISLSPVSDEPDMKGYSSGVGKVLKFSENMVDIYNLKEKELDAELDVIYPLNKIIVYNMDRVFSLLDRIDYENVNRIQFDGETLWIPAEQ